MTIIPCSSGLKSLGIFHVPSQKSNEIMTCACVCMRMRVCGKQVISSRLSAYVVLVFFVIVNVNNCKVL